MNQDSSQRLEALQAEMADLSIEPSMTPPERLSLSTSSLVQAILAAYTDASSITVNVLTGDSFAPRDPSWAWTDYLILSDFTPWCWNPAGVSDIKEGDLEVICADVDTLAGLDFIDLAAHQEYGTGHGQSVLATVLDPDFSDFDEAELHVLAWRLYGPEGSQYMDRWGNLLPIQASPRELTV